MGTLYDWQLRTWEERADGMPVPVGTLAAQCKTTATKIQLGDNGWEYGYELPIYVWLLKHREVVLGDEVLLWTGTEIKLESTAATRCNWQHRDVVAALTNPDSQNWWWRAKFRPVRNRTEEERLRLLGKALREAAEEPVPEEGLIRHVRGESPLPRALEELKFDPFETDDKWLTARMPDPMRFDWRSLKALDRGYSLAEAPAHNPAHRSGPKPGAALPMWSFGVCAEFQQAFEDIKDSAWVHPRFGEVWDDVGGSRWTVQQAQNEILEAAVWQAMAGKVGDVPLVERVVRLANEGLGKLREPEARGHRTTPQRHFTRRILDAQVGFAEGEDAD